MRTSENIRGVEPSATLATAARARELEAQGREIINLGAGEPDTPTPSHIARAGIRAIEEGRTRYTPAAGLPELREAVAGEFSQVSGRELEPDGVVVTAGAKQALFNACFALFGPGDRVLVPVPHWTSYPPLLRTARAEMVPVPGAPEDGFKVSVDRLEAAAGPAERVRGLLLNSPCNPTGAVYSGRELERIARWAAERDVWLVSDEIYSRLCYTAERAPGLLDLGPDLLERTVVVSGASKVFAMTGWRLGYSYSPPELAGRMAALQSHMTSNANTPAQHAVLAALREGGADADPVRRMVERFRGRRERVCELFDEHLPEVSYVRPDGAFYLFFRADRFYDDSVSDSFALCRRLLDETGVALVPGGAFGDDRYIRLSYVASEDTLAEAVRRIAGALHG